MRRSLFALLALVVSVSACTSSSGHVQGPTTSTVAIPPTLATAAADPRWNLVVLGDSLARDSSCEGCTDFPQLYARAITKATGVEVDVDETAVQFSNEPAIQASQLYADILTDDSLREAISGADIVLVNVGFNDTPWNRLDNPCNASDFTATVIQWGKITPVCIARVTAEYKQTLDEIFTEINELRGCWTPAGEKTSCSKREGEDTMLRLTTVYNDWFGWKDSPAAALGPTERTDAAFVQAQCWVLKMHGGRCADVYHLLNGANGNRDAGRYLVRDHTHLSQAGHRLIAGALAGLGFAPLRP